MSENIEPTVVDCFCGAGGLSLGFRMAGFRSVYGFDHDKAAISTFRQNIGEWGFVADIQHVTARSIREAVPDMPTEVDVVAGGPPCQGFSVQRRGGNEDPRNDLVLQYIRLVLEIRPRFFLMENVGGLLSVRGKYAIDELKRQCNAAGYSLHIQKLDARRFGVPQMRRRVFIIGERTDDILVKFAFPTGEPSTSHARTVRDAIGDLRDKTISDVPNHRGDKLSLVNLERIRSIRAGQGRDSLPEHLKLPCHSRDDGHRHLDTYGRMSWDEPSPTITARFDSFSRGRFGHPDLDRTITLREGARLQTFPDDFVFEGSKLQVAKQIGNAVPPLLAKAVAQQILKCL